VTISVTANPYTTPPRNEITVTVPTGDVMKTASLTRIINGVPELVRTQPATGFDTQIVYDYEAPYDTPATYQFTTTYTDPTAVTTAWDETWPNLSNWTGDTGSFAVASGVLSLSASGYAIYHLDRALPAAASYRAVVSKLTASGTDLVSVKQSGVQFLTATGAVLVQVSPNLSGKITVQYSTGATVTTAISGSSPFTVDFLGSSIVVSGTGGTYTVPNLANTDYATVRITTAYHNPGTFQVGEIKTSTYGTTTNATYTSGSLSLSPVNAWIIHPSNPGLSIPISSGDRSTVTIRSIGDVTNQSAATEHVILGQSEPITTTNGPRYSNRLQMVLGVRTRPQELALSALIQDGTPVLIRFPGILPTGFDEGFYSVGDVQRARWAQRPNFEFRDVTLPLTKVQSPVVSVANTGWSFASLAATFDFATVAAAYDSFADVQTDNRNPGY